MKTYTDLIKSWIDCDGTKVFKPRCCRQGPISGSILVGIDHIKTVHPELYGEYKDELMRVDPRITQGM